MSMHDGESYVKLWKRIGYERGRQDSLTPTGHAAKSLWHHSSRIRYWFMYTVMLYDRIE